jgi:hypothetical protein
VLNRKYLFKRIGWPLKGPLGFALSLYWLPWNRQNGHLPLVERLASRFSTQKQQAGLPKHCKQTNPECEPLSMHRGQVNQTSSASMAQEGIHMGWVSGGLLILVLTGDLAD